MVIETCTYRGECLVSFSLNYIHPWEISVASAGVKNMFCVLRLHRACFYSSFSSDCSAVQNAPRPRIKMEINPSEYSNKVAAFCSRFSPYHRIL